MRYLSKVGRIFYGFAITETGLQTIYYNDFPYWLLPPKHSWIPGLLTISSIAGVLLVAAGVSIVWGKRVRPIALSLGGLFLMIFCFYYIPYEFTDSANGIRWAVWHNAEKELAICCGALVIAGAFSDNNSSAIIKFLGRLIPLGAIGFSLTMISFGFVHLSQAEGVSTMVPSWISYPIFWTYFAGIALIGSGIAIITKFRITLIASLLGIMILSWFIILHIPRVAVSPEAYLGSEVTSAFIALAYSGTAFVIAAVSKK